MKKILPTLMYLTLATVVLGYLFRLMQWPEVKLLLVGGFWMHVGAYLLYSFFEQDKDGRFVYPMLALVIIAVLNSIKLPIDNVTVINILLLGIVAFHLLAKDYLGKTEIPYTKVTSIVGMIVLGVGILFKIMHFPGASVLFILGSSIVSLLLVLIGMTKGLERKKKS